MSNLHCPLYNYINILVFFFLKYKIQVEVRITFTINVHLYECDVFLLVDINEERFFYEWPSSYIENKLTSWNQEGQKLVVLEQQSRFYWDSSLVTQINCTANAP